MPKSEAVKPKEERNPSIEANVAEPQAVEPQPAASEKPAEPEASEKSPQELARERVAKARAEAREAEKMLKEANRELTLAQKELASFERVPTLQECNEYARRISQPGLQARAALRKVQRDLGMALRPGAPHPPLFKKGE